MQVFQKHYQPAPQCYCLHKSQCVHPQLLAVCDPEEHSPRACSFHGVLFTDSTADGFVLDLTYGIQLLPTHTSFVNVI